MGGSFVRELDGSRLNPAPTLLFPTFKCRAPADPPGTNDPTEDLSV